MEAEDSSLTKHTVTVPSVSSNTESPSSTSRKRPNRKRKCKKSHSPKPTKEEDTNLGEQLLKEFVDFQSSRPDKICDEEERESYGSTDRCDVHESNQHPLELPIKEERTKDQESGSDLENRHCEESVVTIGSRPETLSPASQNTSKNQAVVLSAAPEEGVAVDKEHSDKSPMERKSHSSAEPEQASLNSEALSTNPYSSDSTLEETEKKIQSKCSVIPNSTASLPIRSSTIPGFETSTASPGEDTYTITELAPANPIDLTALVTSLCGAEESNINYPNTAQVSAASSDPQVPAASRCSSSVVHNSNIWDPSSGVTPLNSVQEGTNVQGEEEDPRGFTIILPPVATKEQADEQFLALFGGNQISEYLICLFLLTCFVC